MEEWVKRRVGIWGVFWNFAGTDVNGNEMSEVGGRATATIMDVDGVNH